MMSTSSNYVQHVGYHGYKYVKMYLHKIRDGVGVMTYALHLDIGRVEGKVELTGRNIKC